MSVSIFIMAIMADAILELAAVSLVHKVEKSIVG